MKKKYVIIIVYVVYVLSLFGIASYYQYLNDLPAGPQFLGRFGRDLEHAKIFLLLCLFSSWLFLTILHFVYRKFFFAFAFLVPFLHLLVSLSVYLAVDFVSWISQLKLFTSDFQKLFFIVSISSTIIMVWFFGDVFKTKESKTNAYAS